MKEDSRVIQSAEFNPNIKTYRFLEMAFYLLISIIGIPVLIVWVLGFGQYLSNRYYKSLHCDLTDRHLEFKKGILMKIEKTIPLENIQDLTFIDNPLLRLFDLRILKIETAGQGNKTGSDLKLIGILNSLEFRDNVFNQREILINKVNNRHRSAPIDRNAESDQMGILLSEMKEIKEILLDIKNK